MVARRRQTVSWKSEIQSGWHVPHGFAVPVVRNCRAADGLTQPADLRPLYGSEREGGFLFLMVGQLSSRWMTALPSRP